MLLHKAKQPPRHPVGELSTRRKAPTYSIQEYAVRNPHSQTNQDHWNQFIGRPNQGAGASKMNRQCHSEQDEDKDSQDIGDFCFGKPKPTMTKQTPGARKPTKIRPVHEKDFDPTKATEEELASMFNLRDQQSYDPRSMEEIQEEQR